MTTFFYKARNKRGEAVEGKLEAASSELVASQLLNSDIIPISIDEVAEKQDVLADLKRKLGIGRPELDDLILFCRQMYTLAKAGVPIIRAITGLAETSRNAQLVESLHRMKSDLESGRELSTAMATYPEIFSTLMVNMVKVGENTGQLDEAFVKLSQYLEMEKDTRDRVKAAMRYPTFVIIFIAIAIGIVNIFVIPAFAGVFEKFDMDLPWQTSLLINTSNFTVAYWPYILSLLIVTIIAVRSYLKTEQGRYRWDRRKLRLPLVGGLLMRATLARFTRSFAMTTRAGVPLVQALTIVARAVDNSFVSERINSMRNGIERGDSLLRTATATSLFTPLVLQMIAVGEETGAVDDLLDEVGGFYEREVDYDLKSLSSAIEPILIVAVGILVLILALGIFLPMWDLTQIAKR
ncbi:MSHA biogenesis protein MshG [Solemya pervernicosa gill symbiont]|uniref:MSHA biogenesis protein MshG n=1 Tax=Solemya pervernicosa gill symbiont TaxID=642797 RepID=A0A1T2L3C0_9GAMM|nr:type II secretion system F family protein [Solemya pervernicosa gill symbiont]OOZ39607.1 MSHA biogenesis protein MshG [Solemya pervernicosa gill symbiont]